jgi:hypothetical protein
MVQTFGWLGETNGLEEAGLGITILLFLTEGVRELRQQSLIVLPSLTIMRPIVKSPISMKQLLETRLITTTCNTYLKK